MQAIMTEIVTITPELAREWLQHRNVKNRHISERMLAIYAADMRDGRWQVNGQAIVFDNTGRLVDGHHRLSACAKYNTPFSSLVVRGVKPESVDSMDLGNARTAGHIAEMKGVREPRLSAAIAKMLLLHERGGIGLSINRWDSPSKLEQVAALERYPEIAESLKTCYALRSLLPPSVCGFCYVVCHRHDRIKAGEFFAALASGEGLVKGSPILALRNRLMHAVVADKRLNMSEQIHLVFRAYLLHAEGRRAERIAILDTFPRVWGGVE